MRRGRAFGATIVAAAVAALTAFALTTGGETEAPPPAPKLANLWWDSDGGSCTRSAKRVAYNDAAACAVPARTSAESNSLRGWTVAQSGDLIGVYDEPGGNDYGVLTTGADAKTVTVRGMGGAGGKPEFAEAVVACDACVLDNLKFENRAPSRTVDHDWMCQGPAPAYGGHGSMFLNGIVNLCSSGTIQNFDIDGQRTAAAGADGCPPEGVKAEADGWKVSRGQIHGVWDRRGMDISGAGFTVEGVRFWDVKRPNICGPAPPDVHNECIYTTHYSGATFRNNRFEGCPSGQGIAMLGSCTEPGEADVTIEGNVFAHTNEGSGPDPRTDWHPNGGVRSLFIGDSACHTTGWVVRYNTFETAPDSDSADRLTFGGSKGQWYGNLGAADCNTALWDYHHNVGDTCGGASSVAVSPSTNTQALPGRMSGWFRDAFNWNFHLVAGAAAIDAGDPANKPAADIDGVRRDDPPDAGAYEFVP